MQTQSVLKLGGIAAIAGGALRLGEPALRMTLTGNALPISYFVIDIFLLFGLVAWYAWRAEKLGVTGLTGFVSGVIGIMTIRSADLLPGQGYLIGATLLLAGLAVMNAPALIRWERPVCPPLLWLIALICAFGSFAYPPLAFAAGAVFGVGYVFAGISLVRT